MIGAWGDDNVNGVNAGSAYIFRRTSSGEWNETAKSTANDGLDGDTFGAATSIYNDDILIGAFKHNDFEGAGYMITNWNSCDQIWQESSVKAGDSYLVNWQWTNCTTQQPTGTLSHFVSFFFT